MSVRLSENIGFSSKSGALMIANGVTSLGTDGKAFENAPAPTEMGTAPWSKWGDNNLLPLEMADHIDNCGVLNAALDAKARIATGKGLQPFLLTNIDKDGETLEWVSDSEIQDFLDLNNGFELGLDLSFDKNGYGMNNGTLILNGKRDRINRIRRLDVVNTRLEKYNTEGFIENIYQCFDWKGKASFVEDKMIKIPALKEGYELEDLIARKDSVAEFAFMNRSRRNGRIYYPTALWYAARAWVKVARSVPNMKNAMFTNQMQIKYLINFSEKYWTITYGPAWEKYTAEEKKAKIAAKMDEVEEWLTGEDNAFKTIQGLKHLDPVTGKEIDLITIEALDDKVKDGKLLPDSSAANSEILFALMMNPALMGAGQPGGPYSSNAGGSNVRESYMVQLMIMESERREIAKIFNVIKKFNGWSDRLEVERDVYATAANGNTATVTKKKMKPRLVFRYPSGLLTTLDTGKSSKSETV